MFELWRLTFLYIIYMFWHLILLLSTLETCAVFFIKKHSQKNNFSSLLCAILFYATYAYFLSIILKNKKISVTLGTAGMTSLIAGTLLGYFLHGEMLSKTQCCGILLAITSIYLLI